MPDWPAAEAASEHLKSEVAIVCGVAKATSRRCSYSFSRIRRAHPPPGRLSPEYPIRQRKRFTSVYRILLGLPIFPRLN
jgi:hypothetical protein